MYFFAYERINIYPLGDSLAETFTAFSIFAALIFRYLAYIKKLSRGRSAQVRYFKLLWTMMIVQACESIKQ